MFSESFNRILSKTITFEFDMPKKELKRLKIIHTRSKHKNSKFVQIFYSYSSTKYWIEDNIVIDQAPT